MRFIAFLPRLYVVAIVLMCAGYAWRSLHGTDDFWAHAAVGRWIWQHHSVPRETLYLWGTAPTPWIAHSWLSQLTFYGLMAVGGERGGPYLALALTFAIAATTFLLLFYRVWLAHARATILLPPAFMLAVWLASPRFHPRPELFSALGLAILLTFLADWYRRSPQNPYLSWRLPVGIVALFALWANFHGGVAMGLAVLLIAVVGDALQDIFSPGARTLSPRTRWLAVLVVAAVIGVCLNPYGLTYWSALKPIGSSLFADIDEWKPFWKYPAMTMSYVYGCGVMVALTLGVWAANPARRITHLLWVLFIAASFVMQRRHLWTLAELCLFVIAVNIATLDTERLWELWRRWSQPDTVGRVEPIPAGMRLIARLGVVTCLGVGVAKAISNDILPIRAVGADLPQGMAAYVLKQKVPTPVMNDYENSSYLQWRLHGKPPLFIDLLNAYPPQLLADYFEIIGVSAKGKELMRRHHINTVILRKHEDTEGVHVLAKYLDGQKDWKPIYRKADGTIWVRAKPAKKP